MSILIFFANDLDHQNITIVLQMIHIILIGRKLAMWSANDPENGMARCDSSFLQMVRQKGRPGATVLFFQMFCNIWMCRLLAKRVLWCNHFLLQIMNSVKMGQPHVMQLPTVLFLQMIIRMSWPLAERTVCQDNFFVF